MDLKSRPTMIVRTKMDSSYQFPHQHKNRNLSIVTVNIESPLPYAEQLPPKEFFWERVALLENVVKTKPTADIILFPAGFFEAGPFEEGLITEIGFMLNDYLKKVAPDTILCYGLDFDCGRDQLAFAVNAQEILAIGRKFYPTEGEKGKISVATGYHEKELNYNRTFYVKDTKCYLAVCYDGFGIRHRQEKNPDVHVVLDLVHGFYPKGTGLSGDVDFARKGFTGASLEWNCPVFGAAVFFERKVPPNFPTGVFWTNHGQSVKGFKYEDNEMQPLETFILGEKSEKAYCKVYKI